MQPLIATGTVLLVEADEQSRSATRALLTAYGFKALGAASNAEALQLLEARAGEIHCLLADLSRPDGSGMDLLRHVRRAWPELPVVVVTGPTGVTSALGAVREGAFDFQLRPLSPEVLTFSLGRAIEHHRLEHRNRYLQQRLEVAERSNRDVDSSRPRLRAVIAAPLVEARARFERGYLEEVLQDSAGNLSQAARRAGMDRSNFRRLLDRHGVRAALSEMPTAPKRASGT